MEDKLVVIIAACIVMCGTAGLMLEQWQKSEAYKVCVQHHEPEKCK